MKHKKQQGIYTAKLKEIFLELDHSGDGYVTWEEFSPALGDKRLRTYLHTLDIDTHDLEHLFELLHAGDGTVVLSDFIENLSRVKGAAKNIDVLKLHSIFAKLQKNVEKKLDSVLSNLHLFDDKIGKFFDSVFSSSKELEGKIAQLDTASQQRSDCSDHLVPLMLMNLLNRKLDMIADTLDDRKETLCI